MLLWLPRRPPSLVPRAAPAHARRAHHALARPLIAHLAQHQPRLRSRLSAAAALARSTGTSHQPLRLQSTDATASTTAAADAKPPSPAPKESKEIDKPKEPLGTRVWKKVKHEAQHYWSGTKLLVSEVRISARLQWKILHGDPLTRREHRQVCIIARRVTILMPR
jgi:LETM1 and EF-hand domain-containing protein 1